MIIGEPRVTEEKGQACLTADVRIETPGIEAPGSVWWKFPVRYAEYAGENSDALVIAMLPVAMRLGEDMEVRGRVSPRLAYGVREYQCILHAWWPEELEVAEIDYADLSLPDTPANGTAVGCAFSGGVDSFYSLWRHLAGNEDISGYRITHCLMIDNFDMYMPEDIFPRIVSLYEETLRGLGIEIIPIRTNLRKMRLAAIEREHSPKTFGAVLAASALVLEGLFRRFYIPASHKYSAFMPLEGAHPLIDHWLSTETMEMIHDGSDSSRVEKTAVLSNWPETYSRLRVCFGRTAFNENTGQVENCCQCEKCVRTMISLELLGALSRYNTFGQPLSRRQIRGLYYSNEPGHALAEENLHLARTMGRRDIAFDMRYAMWRSLVLRKIGHPVYHRMPPGVQRVLKRALLRS